MNRFLIILISCCAVIGYGSAGNAAEEKIGGEVGESISIPSEVSPLIPSNFYPIYLKKVDLNGDELPDYLMVLEDNIHKGEAFGEFDKDTEETNRPLIILQRGKDGKLMKVKENDNVVYCRICGGVMGDPFEGIQVTKKGFVVRMYGGSNMRWAYQYEFAYSRRDKTWQLIRVSDTSFGTDAPDKEEVTTYKPPKDFGKIDLADFDPDNFLYKDTQKKGQ
jgi:hypothetical protein